MACSHNVWLDLQSSSSEVFLVNHGLLERLKPQFLHASTQTPSIVTLFSGPSMNSLNLVNGKKSQKRTWLNMWPHALSMNDRSPLLFAHFDPRLRRLSQRKKIPPSCHEESGQVLSWYKPSEPGIAEKSSKNIHGRGFQLIIHPFSDVICCFADDYGGISGVANIFGTMLISTNASYVHPRLIIVSRPANRAERLMRSRAVKFLTNTLLFSSIRIVELNELKGENFLLNLISLEAEIARRSRMDRNVLFSYVHLQELLEHSCDLLSLSYDQPLDILRATRIRNPPQVNISHHIASLLDFCVSQDDIECKAPILVALSIILDGFSQDNPYFQPHEIIKAFYETECLKAFSGSKIKTTLLPQTWMSMVGFQVERLLREKSNCGGGDVAFHKKILSRNKDFYRKLVSNTTCFLCLSRPPEAILPCGHGACESCFQHFGDIELAEHYAYSLDRCPMCHEGFPRVVLKLKPPTAGFRILTLDGGGVRGIIPLQFLRALQDQLALPIPIQEHFDMAFGTSSGGLIILGLYLNGWSVEECEQNFVALSQEAFTPRLKSISDTLSNKRLGFLASFLQRRVGFLISLLADSQYSEKWIERAVQQAFGDSTRMMDVTYSHRIGCKVGVTATTTKTSSPCIFTNYSSSNCAFSDLGYRHISPQSRCVGVWEAARCTSAAPWFFKSYRMKGVGSFQDGGLWQNNPVDVAEWEARRLWPLIRQPDLVISLGTGISSSSGTPKSAVSPTTPTTGPFSQTPWSGRFVPRLLSSFLQSLDGQKAWSELWNRLGADLKSRYHRLNVVLNGKQPVLDDITQIKSLKHATMAELESMDLPSIVERMIAAMFFLELDDMPVFTKGSFVCRCTIFSRLNKFGEPLRVLVGRLANDGHKFFVEDGDAMDIANNQLEPGIKIKIKVPTLKHKITVALGKSRSQGIAISGFPVSIQELIDMQQLNSNFGKRACNGKRKRNRNTLERIQRSYQKKVKLA